MARAKQGRLVFRSWGGARAGAGRKPRGARPGVSHARRGEVAARLPVHVTLKVGAGLPSLRRVRERGVLFEAFADGCEREGFRVVQFSLQRDHVHLIAEAGGREALARGVQGLCVRIARRLNRLWGRRVAVFADRCHGRVRRTPREVRNALAYVLQNQKRHGAGLGQPVDLWCSSGAWFDGWGERLVVAGIDVERRPVARARSWLLRVGWRRHGPVEFGGVPGPPPRRVRRR